MNLDSRTGSGIAVAALRSALMLPLAIALAGCGSSSTASTAVPSSPPQQTAAATETPTPAATLAQPLDACTVITLPEAQTFAHTALQAGTQGNPDEPSCTYNSAPTGPTAQVEIHIGQGAKKFYDLDVSLGHSFKPVPSLGDEAYLEDNAIFFKKGATWVSISTVLLDVDAATIQSTLPGLAKTAAGRV